jgi:tRNA(Ser,Leu) C12 N-acetylase TAN1
MPSMIRPSRSLALCESGKEISKRSFEEEDCANAAGAEVKTTLQRNRSEKRNLNVEFKKPPWRVWTEYNRNSRPFV